MRRSVRGGTLGALVAVLALTGMGAAGASAPAARHSGVPVRVWVTSVDRAELLHERPPVSFHAGASAAPTIVVDPHRTYQSVDGFGASITDSSAAVLYGLAPAAREDAMRQLFDPATGIGVSFLRQPIGS